MLLLCKMNYDIDDYNYNNSASWIQVIGIKNIHDIAFET